MQTWSEEWRAGSEDFGSGDFESREQEKTSEF
jgi:hypothetical protein